MTHQNPARQASKTKATSVGAPHAQPARASSSPREVLQRAQADPASLSPSDLLQLQRAIGNRATGRLLAQRLSVQTKLQLGPANDKYEQEADAVARQVVRRMAAPPVQRDDKLGEDWQGKSRYDLAAYSRPQPAPAKRGFVAPKVQRDEMDEELAQAKPLAATISAVQRSQGTFAGHPVVNPYAQREESDEALAQAKPLAATISNVQRSERSFAGRPVVNPYVQRDEMDDALAQAKPLAATISSVQRSEQLASASSVAGQIRQQNPSPELQRYEGESDSHFISSPTIQRSPNPSVVQRVVPAPFEGGRIQRDDDEDFRNAIRSRRGMMTGMGSEDVENETAMEDFASSVGKRATEEAGKLTGTMKIEDMNSALKERFQAHDSRYLKRLKEIGPKAPESKPLGKERIGALNSDLKERFQAHDPRYLKRLEEIGPKAPESKPLGKERIGALQNAMNQDKEKQRERVERQQREYAVGLAQAESKRVEALAKIKFEVLLPMDQKALTEVDATFEKKSREMKESKTKDPVAYWLKRRELYQYVLEWSTLRISRRSLLKMLHNEVASHPVQGQFAEAFRAQAALEYAKISGTLLTAERGDVKMQITSYRKALTDLAEAHKRVHDLGKETGAKYGGEAIQSLVELVTTTISNVKFDIGTDGAGLDQQINTVRSAYEKLSRSLQGRMETAGKREVQLTEHSTNGQDSRGQEEETDAIEKAKQAFEDVQSKIKGRKEGISTVEVESLKNSTDVLTSFADRTKETKAHDMKAKYEAAPYYLDERTSKIVHAERHIKGNGTSKYKTALELEKDYKNEVDNQYKASKSVWCKYLGYTNGTGQARVTNSSGGYDGVAGHHSVFLDPYTDIINANTGKASEKAPNKTADALLDVLYPSNGILGAHYTLEFTEPKPHAYRGGSVVRGAKYRNVDNITWQNVRAYMQQQQTNEEARVRGLIQDALNDHMKKVHRLDPSRRK